ncbi:MAG: ribosome silencing factor [Nitrospirae bacterium]|nr:MAG: ribosome silencing factor [Nitrospirota bacterium]
MVPESKAKALAIAQASFEKKASDVVVLHVAKLTSVADYLVVCSGESERQVRAIADHIDAVLSAQRHPPRSVEGVATSQWILMDFGDVVVHVFRADIRQHYGLEKLWGDAKPVRLPAEQSPVAVPLPVAKPRRGQARKQG